MRYQDPDFPGQSFPLGASVVPGGVNFSVFAKNATGIELLLFAKIEDAQPIKTIVFDPVTNRTGHYWHALVQDVKAGQINGYSVAGPPIGSHSRLSFPSARTLETMD